MITYKQLIENISDYKKTHYGTCVNCFDSKGNRKKNKGNVPYRDVTDFAQSVTDDQGNNKKELKISKEEFLKHSKVDREHEHILHDPSTEFLYLPERDSHIMYDTKKDIHHFYEK